MRGALLVILISIAQATASTQTPSDRDEVLKVVQAFFDTMLARDVEGARNVLVPEGHFFAVDMRTPKARTQLLENEEYFKALQQGKSNRRERMWSPEVRVHGAIATVWTPYDFWIDGKFSHCGVDAFDLIKGDDGWKIAGGVFTTEAKCEPSPLGPRGK